MNLEIITKQDLAAFKSELLTEIRQLMQPGQGQSKKWLKSNEVRKLLNISPGLAVLFITNRRTSTNYWKVA